MVNLIREKHLTWARNTLFFGLIVFYCGIYIFSDGGDNARAFYLLVLLPMLFILFSLGREFFQNRYIWLLLLLPIYLTASHFWAPEANIIRSTTFHLKKVIYIFFFILAVIYIVDKKPSFSRILLQSLLVVGVMSALVSIICFLLKECGMVSGRLASFSVQDINKAGAIYTITMALSLFFLIYGFRQEKHNSYLMQLGLIVCFVIGFTATYYARTHATWIMLGIMIFLFSIPKWSIKNTILLFGLFILALSLFLYFDGYTYLMKDGSFNIRVKLVQESLSIAENNILFGVGMTHKLPLLSLPHPHNIIVDVYRFGGIIGILIFSLPILYFVYKGMVLANTNVLIRFYLAWFIGSVAIMTVYGQQPITRPGGYIWFLYWMPLLIFVAEISRADKGDASCQKR